MRMRTNDKFIQMLQLVFNGLFSVSVYFACKYIRLSLTLCKFQVISNILPAEDGRPTVKRLFAM